MSEQAPKDSATTSDPGAGRPDAFGVFVYVVYVAVGGLLVFMFAWSLRGAVDTQNASICSAMRPEFRTRVLGTVTKDGAPLAGVSFVSAVPGAPAVLSDAQGQFTLMLPEGAHEVAATVSGETEPTAIPLVVGPSEDLEVAFDLSSASATIESRGAFMAPEIEAQDLQGNPVKLSDFRGKLVLVNFWATWCEPCITEWPQLDQLAARLGDRDDVVVLAVSIDQEQKNIAPFLERMSLSESGVKVLWDPTGEINRAYGSDKIPDTFFVDESGRVSAAFVDVRKWGNPEAFHCVDGTAGRARG